MKEYLLVGAATVLLLIGIVLYLTTGTGGFERMITRSGVYAVCRPGGYDAVCFLDADSKEGGLSCLPLSEVSKTGECRK